MTERKIIDLRSDTITQPSPAMHRAMNEAPLGDDVYGEDPTVNHLEALAAELLGKEAAVFVPSGTMGNLVCLLTHCDRGTEYLVGSRQHTYLYEAGGAAGLGSIHPKVIPNQVDGTLTLAELEAAIHTIEDPHFARTRLISLENTHNRQGGRVLPMAYIKQVREIADRHNLKLHCDGARLWNAAVALGASPATVAAPFDSLSVCLSKGLAAPVGSIAVGTRDFIHEARRARKILGGGMRQAGVIAAAGIVALSEMIERLADDHAHAGHLAEGLRAAGYHLLHPIETNIVYFEPPAEHTPADLAARWREQGLLISPVAGRSFRAVTHYGIEAADIERTLAIMAQL
jgi:threonine aldolase